MNDITLETIEKITSMKRCLTKLNIGCGNRLFDGWLNIGIFNKVPLNTIYQRENKLFYCFDITNKMDFSTRF